MVKLLTDLLSRHCPVVRYLRPDFLDKLSESCEIDEE